MSIRLWLVFWCPENGGDQTSTIKCEDNMLSLDEVCSDLCSVHPLQDAFDAVGYFQLALAAALEDRANPEALYVVYMKLAEIHGNHMPNAELCQIYRDRARSLKRVLAGEEVAVRGKENVDSVETEDSDANVEHAGSNFTSMSENEKCKDESFPRTCMMQGGIEDSCTDTDLPAHFLDDSGSETETSHQSCSDSIFTESFDTAKEQMSDSCSSTDTLQTEHSQRTAKDSDIAHDTLSHITVNHRGSITNSTDSQNTDCEIQEKQNALSDKTEARVDHIHEDVQQSDAGKADTVDVNTVKAVGVGSPGDHTDNRKSSETHSEHLDFDDDDT